MALTYQSPLRSPERILSFGVQGTGKSNAILQIARKLPDATFHVIDNDMSPSYNRALDSEYSDLTNVAVHETDPDDWKDCLDTAKRVAPEVKPNHDWMVFDSMSSPWGAVQSWFVEHVHGVDEADYFMQVREAKAQAKAKGGKESKSLGALDGWMDWPVINKQYFLLTRQLLKVNRGHLYMTAELGKISDDDDAEVKKLFGAYGVKPVGQKRLGYMPHTVLLLAKTRAGEYEITTVKDRNRREMEGEKVTDFGKDYLQGVCGWKVGVVADEERVVI